MPSLFHLFYILILPIGYYVFGRSSAVLEPELHDIADRLGHVVFGGSSDTWQYARNQVSDYCAMYDAITADVIHRLKMSWIGLSS